MINKERGPRDIVNRNRLRLLIVGVNKVTRENVSLFFAFQFLFRCFSYYYQHTPIELLKIQITKVPISKYFYHLSSNFWTWLCCFRRLLFIISLGPHSLLIIILLSFFNKKIGTEQI